MKVFGVTGWKNAGKTGLMERLVSEFIRRGVTVSTVKHAHHTTDVDQPGRDSHRHRSAGATEVLLASPHRWALMHELRDTPEPPLADLLARLSPVDLVLIEGYKNDPHPKVEVWREATAKPPIAQTNDTIQLIASDGPGPSDTTLPVIDLNDTVALADAIAVQIGLNKRVSSQGAFDRVIMVDWSSSSKLTPAKPSKDSIWIAEIDARGATCTYHRGRRHAMTFVMDRISDARASQQRVLVGFDFAFGYPKGFAEAWTGSRDPFSVWKKLAQGITDTDKNTNNRWDFAGEINTSFAAKGPFWGNGTQKDVVGLPRTKVAPPFQWSEYRKVETVARAGGFAPKSCWQLSGVGSVGSQSLTGLPHLHELRMRFGSDLAVWPFEAPEAPIVLAEIYPSLLKAVIEAQRKPDEVLDCAQVRVMAQAVWALDPHVIEDMLRAGDPEEGWILGVGHEDVLAQAARKKDDT